jgi:phage terminase large subunit-like protein
VSLKALMLDSLCGCDWQKQIMEQIYEPGVRRAIISMGRKNGKTFMVSLLTLAHLCGPAHRRNSQIFSAAQSRDQASLVFGLAAKMVRMSPRLNTLITVRESRKELFSSNSGAVYRALSADASTAYGLSPAFIVHDELGQVRGPKSELYEALETATGAHENPLSVIISTQAPSDNDLLSMLIEAAPLDPKTALVLHTSSMDADPFAEETIKAANPAYGDFLNAVEVADMARVAEAMPSREAEYRNLILNQRVQAENPFISHAAWSACGAAPVPIEDVPVYGALDLAATTDLTCLILAGKVDDVWQVYPHFWLPADGLAERSRRDRVEYDRFARDGLLHTVPGNVIDYDFVAMFLREQFDK